MERPKLRPIEAFTVRHKGQEVLCLRDPQGISDKVLSMSLAAAPILQFLDGEHTLAEIQQELTRSTGTTIPMATLSKLVQQLDESLILESPRFDKFRREFVAKYRAEPLHKATHSGVSYPAKAADIHRVFAQHFAGPKGPGMEADPHAKGPHPPALIIPHIDLRVGGPSYAWAYAQLRNTLPVDTFIILGVAHSGASNRFVGTKKSFETPLGIMPTNTAFMDRLAGKLSFDLYADEFAHRNEHSIEFQVVYLQHLLGAHHHAQIVPILTGSFHDLMEEDKDPLRDKQVASFVQALRETIEESGQRICIIASVDLAHVGKHFGDEFTINESVLKQLEIDDREMLMAIEACDAESFRQFIYFERDSRRVDAWPTVFTLLHVLDVTHGKLLHYAQNHEHEANSIVTFASLRLD